MSEGDLSLVSSTGPTHENVGKGRLLKRLLKVLVPPRQLAPDAYEFLHFIVGILDLAHCKRARIGPVICDDCSARSEQARDNEEFKELSLVFAQVELVGERLEDAQVRLVVVRVWVGA